jgi:hypothetical protein
MLRPALASLALVLAACASKPPPPPVCPAPPKVATEADMKRFGDEMAACADAACRDEVVASFDGYLISFETLVGDASPGESNADSKAALVGLRVIEERACACADAACAERIQGEFETWAKASSTVKGSQAEADEAGEIAERISDCMVKAMSGE